MRPATSLLSAVALIVVSLTLTSTVSAQSPWMGVGLQGATVTRVTDNSPANWAGIESGDVVLSVDGRATETANDVVAAVASGTVGDFSVVRIKRADKRLSLAVFLVKRPSAAPSKPAPVEPSPQPAEVRPAPSPSSVATLNVASLKGEVVVVEFMTTWCGACKSAAPSLAKWQRTHREAGLRVIAASYESPSTLLTHRSKTKLAVEIAHDADGNVARSHGVEAFPTFVVFDRKGKVRGKFRGAGGNLEKVHDLFVGLLAEEG